MQYFRFPVNNMSASIHLLRLDHLTLHTKHKALGLPLSLVLDDVRKTLESARSRLGDEAIKGAGQ